MARPARKVSLLIPREKREILRTIDSMTAELKTIRNAVVETEGERSLSPASWKVAMDNHKELSRKLSLHLQIFVGKLIPESKEAKKIRAEVAAQKKSWFSRLFRIG